MIQSWKSREAQLVFEGRSPKGFPADLVRATRRRLERLDAATTVEDLRVPPGHRLHRLGDDHAEQSSSKIGVDQRQRPVPHLFRLGRPRPGAGRVRGLSLRATE